MLKSTVHLAKPFSYALGIGLQTRLWTYLTSASCFFQRCDAESRELIFVGDLNCDVNKFYEYYVNCGHTNEMKVLSTQLCLRFKQSLLSPKNDFGASTGFEPMASALALQCSTS